MSRTAACLCIAATVALAQPTALPTAPPTIPPTTTTPAVATTAHIHFLLDRSGSMHAIASDVIGGYNAYVAEQQALENSTTGMKMTLVQFDSQDPHEILFSGEALADVPLLRARLAQQQRQNLQLRSYHAAATPAASQATSQSALLPPAMVAVATSDLDMNLQVAAAANNQTKKPSRVAAARGSHVGLQLLKDQF